MNELMFNELSEHVNKVEGDLIDFRVYKGTSFSHLVRMAKHYNRHAYGMDTFYGLEAPTPGIDINGHGYICYPQGYAKSRPELVQNAINAIAGRDSPYTLLEGPLVRTLASVNTEKKFAVAIVDLLQYHPTKIALNFLKEHMAEGGMIYFNNYTRHDSTLSTRAVDEFITECGDYLTELDPIILNENVLNVKRVIWQASAGTFESEPVPDPVPKMEIDERITIALVLRSGGDTYNARYVNALAENIRNNISFKVKVAVLTDIPKGIDMNIVDEIIPLKHKYKGWWSKIELFRPDIFDCDRVVYMDLDTVVVGNIDEIVKYNTVFAGIRDLYHMTMLQTGILVWNPQFNHHIYHEFAKNPVKAIEDHSEGDAKWIRQTAYNYDFLQDEFPHKIVSFKAHCLNKTTGKIRIPPHASIVCFHGRPRPHTITDPIITRHWKY